MTFESITNRGEFFSNHYLDAIIAGDLGDLRVRWEEAEQHEKSTARSRLKSLPQAFFSARAGVAEASHNVRPDAIRALNDTVLTALGFHPARTEQHFTRATIDTLRITTAATVETPTGLLLGALDAGFASDVDDLFATDTDDGDAPGLLLDPCCREAENKEITAVPDAVGELFAIDDPPRFVLVVGGSIVLLAERAKWAEGRYLAVDLDAALERNDIKAKGELETIAALFSADALIPDEGQSVIDELVENSHKHAVGVSKELRNGIRESIEILANEVIQQRLAGRLAVYDGPNRVDPTELTRQCLRYLYRLLVLLYAESRSELGVLPVNDEAYLAGYSLDRLRELTLVELDTDAARHGSHIHESFTRLFELVNDGYHADHAVQVLVFETPEGSDQSYEEYLLFPGLDAALFEPKTTALLDGITLHNEALQRVLSLLMLSPEGKGKGGADRGFISYAQLGINQLGAVYEGLMAYSGFFATEDLYEVAKHGDPSDGTWMLPTDQADEYPDDVFVKRTDDVTGREERVLHPRGSFVFRLSGRDRQRSASYYTPEVLTRCVVKHALAELLGLDDYAPEHGSSGITDAVQMLDLTICEPALGSGAFLNEAINQLSAEFLRRRQAELGESLDPERYQRELQKVKAHYALHQCYGVDLNATAVELAEVSLWLNAMYPGLKAPWFGLQLRRGNSLIGCRRATWRTNQLGDRPWAQTKKGKVQPPVDRKLAEPLDPDEIHHFLLPGHGWAAVADRREAKELRPDEAKALKDWRRQILKAPKKTDAKRLTALSAGVESMWAVAAERIRLTQQGLRRHIDVYGAHVGPEGTTISRDEATRVLGDPDSALGRLRTLMDAWVGLWLWPLDTGVSPPSWEQWLAVAEDLIRPDERYGPSGQLDLFDDLDRLLETERNRQHGQVTVGQLKQAQPWLAIAVDAARFEGAWHWELEFPPAFRRGGFDLQVGNPPWVRPIWEEDLVLAEYDPWWGVSEKPAEATIREHRQVNLKNPGCQASYLAELASAEGLVELLRSPVQRPLLTGIQTNLYMVFMDTVWRHLGIRGTAGLLHPESHFTDPKAGGLRCATYVHLRRHYQFTNQRKLFEEITNTETAFFGLHVYGSGEEVSFIHIVMVHAPETVDGSLTHDDHGPLPGYMHPEGGWDLRPHRSRITRVTETTLGGWARLFDEPGTPATEARLLRPVTTADLEALSVLGAQPVRLADHDYYWTAGWHEKGAKTDGTIRWETAVPGSWDEVILQGPHFTVAAPFAKQPNVGCKNNRDYSDWDLESLRERVIPRTNYQRSCDGATYESRSDYWNGQPNTNFWRFGWRRMTQPGLERSLQGALIPPGASHVHTVHTLVDTQSFETALLCGLWSSLPIDYLVKVSGKSDIQDELIGRFPVVPLTPLRSPLLLRTLRLNCLTAEYAPLWEELFDPAWKARAWTNPELTQVSLGDVGPIWTMDTPLRRDSDRWQALVELDALAALMLGLSAEQLCAMYRTQFAVLRKYEYKMVFDSEGRKICGYHQSAGYRQDHLQDRAKAGDLPPEWKSLWRLYEQYEQEPESVDWLGHYVPPFTRAGREAAMTRAYMEFGSRLDSGEYER